MDTTITFKVAAPRAEQEASAALINTYLTTVSHISINGTHDPSCFAVSAVRAARGLNKWGLQAQFSDCGGGWTWLNAESLRLIAAAMPAPAPGAPLAAPTVYPCDNCGHDVADRPWYCVECSVVVCSACIGDHEPHLPPDPQPPAAREAALPIATVCPECGTRGQVLPDPYGLIRPALQCAACPTCTRVYRVQATLAPDPDLPAYNPEDGAPCAQCGHGQELHYNGVAECWESSDTTPPVGCPCPQFQAREAAQRADEAERRTVQCIHLERAEGLTWECSMEHVVFSLEDAESKLYEWAWTAPEPDQGYHKADVRIEYTDGTTHYVRADLQRGRYGYLPMPAPRPEPPNPADQAELQAGLLATLPPMAGGSVAPRCPDCGDSGAARDCEPCVLATLPPMAGGAPSHYDDPAWYADEAWHLQEERNAESAREDAEAEAEHTHFCPTCHQARPCTGTGCADGPRECTTCSNCRGW